MKLSKPQKRMLLECMFGDGIRRMVRRAYGDDQLKKTWDSLERRRLISCSMAGDWYVTWDAKDALAKELGV